MKRLLLKFKKKQLERSKQTLTPRKLPKTKQQKNRALKTRLKLTLKKLRRRLPLKVLLIRLPFPQKAPRRKSTFLRAAPRTNAA
jgi:hypothetical protein